MESAIAGYVGQTYTFDDDAKIKIVHVKRRDEGLMVMYEVIYKGCLPRRLILPESEFIGTFGHLFFSDGDRD